MRTLRIAFAAVLSLTLARAQAVPVDPPAAPKSAQPNLTVLPDQRVLLSWVEPVEGGHRLVFTVRGTAGWSAAKVVATGANWFVNWADFPCVVGVGDKALAAHWLVRSADGTYDYDVTMARSTDAGATWGKPFVPHRDGVAAEHGFVSLLPMSGAKGTTAVFWLDGREMGKERQPRGSMTLRYVEVGASGELAKAALLDPRVCECCQTSAAMTAAGPLVVYRDRSDGEVRDIYCVRRVDGIWTKPRAVHDDAWKIHGCPVNGPSVAAAGSRVAVAWFTAAADKARVLLAFSKDGGATFGEPVVIDDQNPVGRVEVAIDERGDAYVCWLAREGQGAAVRCGHVQPAAGVRDSFEVAKTSAARGSGFPQMVCAGGRLWFAWTDGTVRSAYVKLPLGDR